MTTLLYRARPLLGVSLLVGLALLLAVSATGHGLGHQASEPRAIEPGITAAPGEDGAEPPSSPEAAPTSAPGTASAVPSVTDGAAQPAPLQGPQGGTGPIPVSTSTASVGWALPAVLILGAAVGIGLHAAWPTQGAKRAVKPEREAEPAPEPDPEPRPTPAPVPTGLAGVLQLGQRSVDAGDYERAVGWFETAIALQPDLSVAHLCLGLSLAELGRREEALESLEAAERMRPEDALARYSRARLLARMGRQSEAIDALAPLALPDPRMTTALLEDPAFQGLHDHPRFLALVGRL